MAAEKPIKCIVLDAGPLIMNDPSISTLLNQSEQLYTTSAVVSEVRDPVARARLQTTVTPFLTIRDPSAASLKVISEFARRTGDLSVLSRTDQQIIALAYELECEKNGGDWRLRKVPGQKTLNGPAPSKTQDVTEGPSEVQNRDESKGTANQSGQAVTGTDPAGKLDDLIKDLTLAPNSEQSQTTDGDDAEADNKVNPSAQETHTDDDGDSDGEWITSSNIAGHKTKDAGAADAEESPPTVTIMQVATVTTDYAMQNVMLQMNLNLLSTTLRRIHQAKSHILRCHACFTTTRNMNKQFCDRCGKPTLTRVACSTKSNGTFVLHLKKNFQYNKRGDRYSIPKPVSGAANGRSQGGGKGGWGNDLILTEDQKEYERAMRVHKKTKESNLMDEDYLPSILTGSRDGGSGGRPKVGAGRNVNSRKR